ncbi:Ig-like domain-containing protein [Caenorhabditis elegans]|uniref:Ig-like domain-containing protein n=1 Tax=Caenorhabditis elegans TaxID=6239 RepID=Q22575_CAEEL|nr:Ig-like domain-containing protein [Caenorhabditis elegans]CCD71849.1 Ig-like domain-containing protein [Caenorhabditis elegans]|eukprot:NP_495351.2 One IG domain [Caenorhabditis elegans]
MSLLSNILLVGLLSLGQSTIVQPEQIAKTVFLNDTIFVAYNSSTTKCRIDCADAETMLQQDFRSFQKVWMFNKTEMFSADDKTFIDSNRSLEFQVLNEDDTGAYQCCIRSTDLAYQSFVCYSTLLTVVDEMPGDGMNETATTEAPPSPSWNVVIEDGEILNAQPENNYFLKIFEDNVTAIHCLVNEVEINIKTSNSFTPPLYNDVLIQSFNLTDHSGIYVCNGTLQIGNETSIETVTFTVSQSWDDNKNADLLDSKVVAEALKTAFTVFSFFFISLFILLQVFRF